jgi:hypothetical protein
MKMRFVPRFALLAAVAGAGAGCASKPPASTPRGAPEQYATLVVRGGAEQARLEGNEYFGPRVRLSFFPDGIRGVVDDQLASFHVREGGRLVGSIGGNPTELYVREGPDWMSLNGLYRGELSNLRAGADGVQGNVGRCGYSLRPQGEPGSFVGRRSCRGLPEEATLLLPPALLARPAVERALMMATLLANH